MRRNRLCIDIMSPSDLRADLTTERARVHPFPPAARGPLVLLPALLCDDDLYSLQIIMLADLAEPIVLTAAETDLPKSAQRVLKRAPARFALAGNFAGGNLALEVLAAAPSRVDWPVAQWRQPLASVPKASQRN